MNEQKAPKGIEWTRIRKPDGTRTRGFTWNVLGGCQHACQWEMPDGKVAECYAKTVAERVAQRAYPDGFEAHYFHPNRLKEPLKLKESAGIFLDSMSDLMGHWVPDEEIHQVLEICREAHWHTFFLLTKNAPRLLDFEFPDNVWVGVSSPPDWMFGKRLSRQQQTRMLHRTLKVLSEVKAKVRWISAEPLSWDCADIFAEHPHAVQWVVIGAASNGPTEYPPDPATVASLLTVLDEQSIPVFYKGNMHTLQMAMDDWREEFPNDLYQPPNDPKPHTITICTAQMGVTDEDTLDITIKSANSSEGRCLAPTWDLVRAIKDGRIDWRKYERDYTTLLRQRYAEHPLPFHQILERDRVVLKCYCGTDHAECHRHLALDILEKIAQSKGIHVVRGGEIARASDAQVDDDKPKQLSLFDVQALTVYD